MDKNREIKIMVVDDSAFMRKIIADMIHEDLELKVIGVAKNGVQALKLIEEEKPDVVTLDIEMPNLNGLDTLKKIKKMPEPPTVIMLSSYTHKGSRETLQALELGAVDFVSKPSGPISLDIKTVQKELISKIKAAYQAKAEVTYKDKPTGHMIKAEKSDKIHENKKHRIDRSKGIVVVIGSSTGGPRALQEVIPNIPKDFPGCILIVQHMPAGFTKLMGERLDSASTLTVKEAQDGEPLTKGRVYIAPGNYHMKVVPRDPFKDNSLNSWQIKVDDSPPVKGLRPCADILFESAAAMESVELIGIVLTGMGSDGSKGLKRLKKAGGYIMAEDESTCVVFGMPKAAINTGLVDNIQPLPLIAPKLLELLT